FPSWGTAEPASPGEFFGTPDAAGDVGVRGRAALPPRRTTPAAQHARLRASLGAGAPHHGAGSACSAGRRALTGGPAAQAAERPGVPAVFRFRRHCTRGSATVAHPHRPARGGPRVPALASSQPVRGWF